MAMGSRASGLVGGQTLCLQFQLMTLLIDKKVDCANVHLLQKVSKQQVWNKILAMILILS